MKVIGVVISILFSVHIICAQNMKEIESLSIQLSKALSIIDSIDIYNQIADEYKKSDSLNATTNANIALRLSKKNQYNGGISDAYKNLAAVFKTSGQYPESLALYKESLSNVPADDYARVARARNGIASINRRQGNYPQALEYYIKNLDLYELINDKNGVASTFNNIGVTYEAIGDNLKAKANFEKALNLYLIEGNKSRISRGYTNMGVMYAEENNNDRALEYFKNALKIQLELGDTQGEAVTYANIGAIHTTNENYSLAIENIEKAIEIFDTHNIVRHKIGSLGLLAETYFKKNEFKKAIIYAEQAYQLATNQGDVKNIRGSSRNLYKSYAALGNHQQAFESLLIFKQMSDSLVNEKNTEELTRLMMQHSFDREKNEMTAENERKAAVKDLVIQNRDAKLSLQRIGLLAAAGGLLLLILLVTSIRKGKRRSDELLHNILPEEVATELKQKGKSDARDFDIVSILFTDFKGFTEQSAKLSAQDLVTEIDNCFQAFDAICETYQIEKIKTIGDSYMAAGGLPVPKTDSIKNTVLAAIEMQAFIANRKIDLDSKGLPAFEMRVGIHTGPVVAGIVGVKKFQYDIWGDTVNTASRIESNGEVDKVNLSQTTYELLKDDAAFSFESRGKIKAKGKGEIEMYFVSRNI